MRQKATQKERISENIGYSEDEKRSEDFENLSGFFELAFKVAMREGIDIGQFDNYQDNNRKYD